MSLNIVYLLIILNRHRLHYYQTNLNSPKHTNQSTLDSSKSTLNLFHNFPHFIIPNATYGLILTMFFNLKLCFLILTTILTHTKSQCSKGCDLALGSYYVWEKNNLSLIAEIFNTKIDDILSYNKDQIPNKDSIQSGILIDIPFSCNCIDKEFLGHAFRYNVRSGDTYDTIANTIYSNLTTSNWVQKFNSYDANRIPDDAVLNVTVNCSCGDKKISKEYGLFVTYPLRPGDSLGSVVRQVNFSSGTDGSGLLRRYNPGVNFSAGRGIVFVPGRGDFSVFVSLDFDFVLM